jgi:hypothetical protein
MAEYLPEHDISTNSRMTTPMLPKGYLMTPWSFQKPRPFKDKDDVSRLEPGLYRAHLFHEIDDKCLAIVDVEVAFEAVSDCHGDGELRNLLEAQVKTALSALRKFVKRHTGRAA